MMLASTIRITLLVTLLVCADGAAADSIRLHDSAGTDTSRVTLGDVAELEGAYAESMRGVVVGTLRDGATKMTIRLDDIKAVLSEKEANWGRLALQGHAACVVYRLSIDTTPVVSDGSPVVANVEDEIGLDTAVTLRDMLIDHIEQHAGVDRVDLRITFRPGDSEKLRRSVFQGRIEITPSTSATLGRLSFNVRRYDGPLIVENLSLMADVEQRHLGLVTTRTVKRGETFTADDVEMRELWLTEAEAPLTDPKLIVGQTASKLMRPGSILHVETIEKPTLVRRNELISVRCHSGGLVIRTVARAKEDGAMNDSIQALNEKTRETFAVTVVGRREGMVLLTPEDLE